MKSKIVYSLREKGLRPDLENGVPVVKNPTSFKLKPKEKYIVDTGLSFSCPTMVISKSSLKVDGDIGFVLGGRNIVLTFTNDTETTRSFGQGSSLAYAVPIPADRIELTNKEDEKE